MIIIPMYVCLCNRVTDWEIRDAVAEGATGMKDLRTRLGVTTGCGCCETTCEEILEEERHSRVQLDGPEAPPLPA